MPKLKLTQFFAEPDQRRLERAYARKIESAVFTDESILSCSQVKGLYEQMKTALRFDEADPGDGTAPEAKKVNLDGYSARYIIATEYLLLTNELFSNLYNADKNYLPADKSRRIYFTINDAVIRTDYCPAPGHIGNYRAYIFNRGKWRDLTCNQFNELINDIVNNNIAECEDKNIRDEKANRVERALFKLMKHWAEEGIDVFNEYKDDDIGTSYLLKVPITKKKNDNVKLKVGYEKQKKLQFLFFFLTVKEVTRRMGIREYYETYHGESPIDNKHYGKSIAFSYFIAMAIHLVERGKLAASEVCKLHSNYGVHSGIAVTKLISDSHYNNIARTKERAMSVAECYHRLFNHSPNQLEPSYVKDVFEGVYCDEEQDFDNIVNNEATIEAQDGWSSDEEDNKKVRLKKPS